jgi:hypothetical protein
VIWTTTAAAAATTTTATTSLINSFSAKKKSTKKRKWEKRWVSLKRHPGTEYHQLTLFADIMNGGVPVQLVHGVSLQPYQWTIAVLSETASSTADDERIRQAGAVAKSNDDRGRGGSSS